MAVTYTFTNKTAPVDDYHIDAEKVNKNFDDLCKGTGIEDDKILARHIKDGDLVVGHLSASLYNELTYGITNAVDNYATLPDPTTLDEGTIYGVKQDTIGSPDYYAGLYKVVDNTPKEWVFLCRWYYKHNTLQEIPGNSQGYHFSQNDYNALIDRYTNLDIPAGAWDYPTSNPAPLDTDTGTNGTIIRQLFDDTTEEFVLAQIKVPENIKSSGTVSFEIYGYASTWVSGKKIQLKLYHSAKNDDENWDAAFSTKSSGDLILNTSGQDVLDELSFSETVANLGWVAGDQVRIKLSRIDASADDLGGDFGLTHLRIRIPIL